MLVGIKTIVVTESAVVHTADTLGREVERVSVLGSDSTYSLGTAMADENRSVTAFNPLLVLASIVEIGRRTSGLTPVIVLITLSDLDDTCRISTPDLTYV